MTIARALTIAGSDSGGGAGIQADLKTFHELDVFGMSVLTALTAQNTLGVHGVHEVPPAFVRSQLDAVVSDIGVDAVKLGMLASAPIASAVAEGLHAHRLSTVVVDPVCASKHGDPLLSDEAVGVLRDSVLPLAEVATPNTGEVEVLTGVQVSTVTDLRAGAEAFHALGPRWVLVKGGHLRDNPEAVDVLFDGETAQELTGRRQDSPHTHGTGCTLAAALTAYRARGLDVSTAARAAKDFVTGAVAGGMALGAGIGPVDHAWPRHARDR